MDSRTHLDYALFQLTPTRTRCDLVIVAGKKKEKLASGLLEPFLLHLKQAKDQISKGGYSLTLKPTSSNASWFTKATLERFVRFVSTPEVLERFVTIEKEIVQIEDSIHQNEQANGAAEAEGGNSKLSAPSKGDGDAIPEENSKVHLMRTLETRKVVLRKEQAMAYARALVAGFEMDYIDDLISFSDSFGAARLREACIKFRELCNKKSGDGIWMDEVAAMQACTPPDLSYLGTSGILIAGDNNTIGLSALESTSHGSLDTNNLENGLQKTATEQSTESKVQIPPWAQYMHNFQGPQFQQMPPPYQGYYLPGMQFPNYPPNVPWPVNVEDSNHKRSSSRNNKHGKGTKSTTKESDSDDLSKSGSSSDSHDVEENGGTGKLQRNKHGKRGSRKVVIRNINYITSKRNGDSDGTSEDDVLDGGLLKEKVDEALGTLEKKHHKSASYKNKKRDSSKHYRHESDDVSEQDTEKIDGAENGNQEWGMFQNLLMKDTDSRGADTGGSTEHYQELVNGSNYGERNTSSFNLESEKTTKYRGDANDSLMFDDMIQANNGRSDPLNFETGKSAGILLKRGGADEELNLLRRGEESRINGQDLSSDNALESATIRNRRHEDWVVNNQLGKFAEQGTAGFSYDDPSMFAGERVHTEGLKRDVFVDDSFMVQAGAVTFSANPEPKTDIFLESDIAGTQSKSDNLQDKFVGSESYEPDDLYMVLGRNSATEQTMTSWNPEMDYVNENSAAEKHSDAELSDAVDNKKPPTSKPAKTAVNRSLGTKGPNRVGRDPLGRTKSDILSRNKTTPVRKTMSPMSKAKQEEENEKRMEQLRIQRQKRIAERSSGNGSNGVSSRSTLMANKKDAVPSKVGKTLPKASNEDTKKVDKPVFRSSTADRLSVARKVDTESSAAPKVGLKKATVSTPQKSAPQNKKLNHIKIDSPKESGYSSVSEAKQTEDDTKEKETPAIKELHIIPSTARNEAVMIPNGDVIPSAINVSVFPDQNGHSEDKKHDAPRVEDMTDVSPSLPSTNTKVNVTAIDKLPAATPEIVVSMDDEKATPPPDDEANADTNYSRKKWNDSENSPKVSKGIRKLLLFGRKN